MRKFKLIEFRQLNDTTYRWKFYTSIGDPEYTMVHGKEMEQTFLDGRKYKVGILKTSIINFIDSIMHPVKYF